MYRLIYIACKMASASTITSFNVIGWFAQVRVCMFISVRLEKSLRVPWLLKRAFWGRPTCWIWQSLRGSWNQIFESFIAGPCTGRQQKIGFFLLVNPWKMWCIALTADQVRTTTTFGMCNIQVRNILLILSKWSYQIWTQCTKWFFF